MIYTCKSFSLLNVENLNSEYVVYPYGSMNETIMYLVPLVTFNPS